MQKRIFSYFFLIVFSSFITFLVFKKTEKVSLVYVDSQKLFKEFKMAIELQKTGQNEIAIRKKKLDSIQVLLQGTKNETMRSDLMRVFIEKKIEIEDFEKKFVEQNSAQIWQRLSLYSNDYAKVKGYDFILDINNKGNIVSTGKKIDVTFSLLSYINKRYEGFE
ncbi:OmpH family outer membrane protein [Flavobacterium cheonhonense]|nr:OmpH family outer membrane protein [Flavobacterium cheonhonense]